MELDAHVRGLLDALAGSDRPKMWQLAPPDARQAARQLTAAVEGKEEIGKVENGTLPGPGGPLPYRAYTPLNATKGKLPGIVYFHGGGWVFGDLDTHDVMCRMLANESGCCVVSIDYRLAPEHRFPAGVEDACAATKWVAANAERFGIDPTRIAVAGDSAGGNLAAVVSQQAKTAGPAIALQVLFCPSVNFAGDTQSRNDFAEGYFLERPLMVWCAEHYIPAGVDLKDPRLSPLLAADLSGLPPAHIHTAGFDPLRDEGKAYADALERSGVKVRYTCHHNMIHHFYAMPGAIPYARSALKSAGADIKAALQRSIVAAPA